MKASILLAITFVLVSALQQANAQLITGYWKGKIDRHTVELKIVKNGDSLTGSSYYYQSKNNYRRYSIRGYFDARDNSVVWWDDVLLEVKGSMRAKPSDAYVSNTDFNCPGGDKMYLTGNAAAKEDNDARGNGVALEKSERHLFTDEWDEVIDNYTVGANDPQFIDSIGRLAFNKPVQTEPVATVTNTPVKQPARAPIPTPVKKRVPDPVSKPQTTVSTQPQLPLPSARPVAITNQQRFNSRTKKLMQEIAVSGDSIELRFYDNAEVDGDSISIFLNNQLLYEHVLLSDRGYIIKLPVASLAATNELVMVAENLGSIPPNTSLMIALVDGQRYEARLESTEQSSALIRLVKK